MVGEKEVSVYFREFFFFFKQKIMIWVLKGTSINGCMLILVHKIISLQNLVIIIVWLILIYILTHMHTVIDKERMLKLSTHPFLTSFHFQNKSRKLYLPTDNRQKTWLFHLLLDSFLHLCFYLWFFPLIYNTNMVLLYNWSKFWIILRIGIEEVCKLGCQSKELPFLLMYICFFDREPLTLFLLVT